MVAQWKSESVECRGFAHPKVTALGVLCCFALFVCLTLLASFFLPSHLSLKTCTCTCRSTQALTYVQYMYMFLCKVHVHSIYIYIYMYMYTKYGHYMNTDLKNARLNLTMRSTVDVYNIHVHVYTNVQV